LTARKSSPSAVRRVVGSTGTSSKGRPSSRNTICGLSEQVPGRMYSFMVGALFFRGARGVAMDATVKIRGRRR
jgi:hypothetical protein